MSESRICPVCKNEIPEDAKFLCPYCHFELKWLDDDGEIQKVKQNFTGELFMVEKRPEIEQDSRSDWAYIFAGVFGGIVIPIILVITSRYTLNQDGVYILSEFLGGVFGGFLVGLIWIQFSKKQLLNKTISLLIPFILGFIVSLGISIIIGFQALLSM